MLFEIKEDLEKIKVLFDYDTEYIQLIAIKSLVKYVMKGIRERRKNVRSLYFSDEL